LYKPLPTSNGSQQYNYLYQLPDINVNSQSRYVLFFGKNPPPAPPRLTDANGNPILTHDEQQDLINHHNLVSQEHAEAANTAANAINAAQGPPNQPAKGGRTRRLHKLKSRKHNKGKKDARVSRRKHNSGTKRH